jgi:exopolysaccharide production protein ExoZ
MPALMLVTGLTAIERDGGLPENPVLKSLGDASYSIYLTHTLAMGAAALTLGIWDTPYFPPVAFVVGTGAGWLVWRFIETPVLAALRRPVLAPATQLA